MDHGVDVLLFVVTHVQSPQFQDRSRFDISAV